MEMVAFIMNEILRHMDTETLERYSMGSSSPEEIEYLETHLLTCDACRNRLNETDSFLVAMRTAAKQSRREAVAAGRGWRFPAWFPAFAAVACGLLLVIAALRSVQSPAPAVEVVLTAMRSNGSGSGAPTGRELRLVPDLTGLPEAPSYRLEIVDHTGRRQRQGILARTSGGIQLPGLSAGPYFVRLYLPSGELVREYGLDIR